MTAPETTEHHLRDGRRFMESLRDFESWLPAEVPGAMDLDCLLERKGHILFIEGKPLTQDGAMWVNYGQWKALSAISKRDGQTVLLVGNDRAGNWVYANIARISGTFVKTGPYPGAGAGYIVGSNELMPVTREQLAAMVVAWYERSTAAPFKG